MNFNVYLDDETGQRLNKVARKAGESRNAQAAVAIRAAFKTQGQPIAAYAVQVAGTALARGRVVATSNAGECRRVSRLQAEDWRQRRPWRPRHFCRGQKNPGHQGRPRV